jgi:hypothetical protein
MSIQKRVFLMLVALFFITRTHAHSPGDTTISIHAVGGLQYEVVRFKVKSGAKVKIIFTNKDDMSHNLVITQPGERL